MTRAPFVLVGLVVHWGAPEALARLLEHWPAGDPQRPLVVVDNDPSPATASLARERPDVRWITPERNLGFGGGLDRAFEEALRRVPEPGGVLVLNPDVLPEPDALDQIEEGLRTHPEAAGIAPRLIGDDGVEQCAWQLRPLPRLRHLLVQCLYRPGVHGPEEPPSPGTPVEQPAAAALALHVETMKRLGGFDTRFFPAWFEDVDFARRVQEAGLEFRYWPQALFRHSQGSSVPALGYGTFLWVYFRNLDRYVALHHGGLAQGLARAVLGLSSTARLLLVPAHRPRRARSRLDAASAFATVALGVLTGFRAPAALAQRFADPPTRAAVSPEVHLRGGQGT